VKSAAAALLCKTQAPFAGTWTPSAIGRSAARADELKQVSRDRQLFSRLAPEVKAQVLHLLNVRGQLNDEVILWSLADESTGVREQALIFAESRLAGSPKLVDAILSWADDSDPRVRFQWAASGG